MDPLIGRCNLTLAESNNVAESDRQSSANVFKELLTRQIVKVKLEPGIVEVKKEYLDCFAHPLSLYLTEIVVCTVSRDGDSRGPCEKEVQESHRRGKRCTLSLDYLNLMCVGCLELAPVSAIFFFLMVLL